MSGGHPNSPPLASSEVEKRGSARADTCFSTSLETNGILPTNAVRGEASIRVNGLALVLRPSFAALVAAEEELGPLFALVERAAAGGLKLGEMAALFWHCLRDRPEGLTRSDFSEALAAGGLVKATPALKVLLRQILQGR